MLTFRIFLWQHKMNRLTNEHDCPVAVPVLIRLRIASLQQPSIKLSSTLFASEMETEVGLLNKAAPTSGELIAEIRRQIATCHGVNSTAQWHNIVGHTN